MKTKKIEARLKTYYVSNGGGRSYSLRLSKPFMIKASLILTWPILRYRQRVTEKMSQ